ncbi:MAG TPA: hypothetical protein VJ812_09310 [Gemmatimonadaceae bacterium]|nr:hypothetical protein [Gemmatimonadaceae bacterium]
MGTLDALMDLFFGREQALPEWLLRQHPELADMRLRRGGLPLCVGGWALGRSSVAAITLWRTVFVANRVSLDAALLLHELRHVHQFQTSATFPLQYLWESVRHGYHRNRFEADARDFAASRLAARSAPDSMRGQA